jgi:hypothetical protein
MLLRVVRSSREMDHHWVATLELGELAENAALVLQLVVRKAGPDHNVLAQRTALLIYVNPR